MTTRAAALAELTALLARGREIYASVPTGFGWTPEARVHHARIEALAEIVADIRAMTDDEWEQRREELARRLR